MSLFRSEEHVNRWLEREKRERGAVVPLAKVWELARAWYVDPRERNWTPRSRDESQRVIESVGLSGSFWQLS